MTNPHKPANQTIDIPDDGKDFLSDTEKKDICDFYKIEPVETWSLNNQGLVNLTCELDDRYFLTFHRRRTREQVEAIAQIANDMDEAIPIVKPVEGVDGYAMRSKHGCALLNPRMAGIHYVGVAHTEKYPITPELHRSLAKFFWELQARLSAVSDELKEILKSSAVINIGEIPSIIPDVAQPLTKYSTGRHDAGFSHPDLIHDDMERQNILSYGSKITGLVDLDSIRTGDMLYEFGHFLFNFVLCDPNADLSLIAVYINELVKAGMIEPKEIPLLYGYIFKFVISDVLEFRNLSLNPAFSQHKKIDLELLVRQYDKALALAACFFKNEFSL